MNNLAQLLQRHADTPDKVDAESLRGVTLTYIDFLAALDERDSREWR